MTDLHVLLVHGMSGPRPWHWQPWLAARLGEQGVAVDLPRLPESARPDVDRWLAVLRTRLAAVPPEAELVVATHSCGSALWLHHAATMTDEMRRADRVLLVAPPDAQWRSSAVRGLTPYPVDAAALRRAAGITRLVVGTGDEYLPMHQAHALAESLQVEMDVILDGAHLSVEDGYGPWPAALAWALYGTVPLNDRYDTDPYTVDHSRPRLLA